MRDNNKSCIIFYPGAHSHYKFQRTNHKAAKGAIMANDDPDTNSHAMVQSSGPHGDIQIAAQILALFVLKGEEDVAFAVILRYAPLSDTDAEQDPYRQFGILAGCLYYDKLEAPIITRASHLLAPFAKTPFKLDYIVKPVVHVLPLYKANRQNSYSCFHSRWLAVAPGMTHEGRQRSTQNIDEAWYCAACTRKYAAHGTK
ncbi:hypothetical protein EDD16DRAFT_1529386 [Pisolithus croceorrhizus]|nr:hypothetical protein EDD16DRAFT_1529386 [Pisolithus croceorrhizus]